MPALKTYREAIFSGWFGPMGVGAVFLAMVAKEQMEAIYEGVEDPPVTIELIKPVVLFIVLSSTLVHGTTIPLFKIGNRIRTRTLSIASTGSGQVLRLPKLQFGQQINMRRNDEDRAQQNEHDEAMSQLKRNTLLNTIQQSHHQHQQHQYQQDHNAINMHDDDDYDGLNEEDFLPDESDETEVGYDDSATPSKDSPIKNLPAAVTTESQSIRFLEPVNPRAGSGNQNNADRNEASVASFRSWMNRNKDIKEETGVEDVAGVVASNPPAHSGGGLRNLFRRHNHKDSIDEQQQEEIITDAPSVRVTSPEDEEKHIETTTHSSTVDAIMNIFPHHHQEQETIIDVGHEKLNPRIEVWDEPNHVVVEDKRDASSHSVIDKSDPNWKHLVKDKINELQRNIDNEVDEKQK